MNETTDQLRAMVVEHFGVAPDKVADDLPFAEMGIDSLTLVDFMFAVEDRYGIDIDHEAAMAEPTLAGLGRLVARLCEAKAPAAA